MSYQYIETQLTQGIAVIWMNRPEQRNALNDVMINEITEFDAAEAYRIGFVNDLASPEELDGTINTMLGHLLLGSPNALAQTKLLIRDMVGRPINEELTADTAARIAAARASVDGQEGIAAFFEKRTPSWVRKPPQT